VGVKPHPDPPQKGREAKLLKRDEREVVKGGYDMIR